MEPTDSEIVDRARAGDERAFRTLVERHGRRVYRLAHRLTGHDGDAEDVAQEAFFKVFRNLDGFESRARFDTWLYRVTCNAAYDLMRRRQRNEARTEPLPDGSVSLSLTSSGHDPEHLAASSEIGQRIAAAMQCLTTAEQAAFHLRHVEGLPIQEIAAALGLQTGAVKNAIFRAVQKMRQQLTPESETP